MKVFEQITVDGITNIAIAIMVLIFLVGKTKEGIKRFIFWRKWKKINKKVRKQDKRKGRIVYKNTRKEFLEARKYKIRG